MKKIYSFLMALCMVFSASANVFEYPIQLEQSNQIAATRVAKKVNVESMKKAVTSMQVAESFESAQVAIEATSKTAAKAAAATTGLQYDATSGDVERAYSAKEVIINKGTGYFQVQATAADKSDKLALVLFGLEDDETIIPVGTYEINGTQTAGTALASTGVNGNSVTLSFYGKTNAAGSILVPCYFLVGGTVEVSAADGVLTIEVNAVNSNDVPVHIVCEYDLNTKQGLPYDATSGSVDRTYSDEDQVVWNTQYAAEGEVYLNITAADKSDKVSLAFFVDGLDDVTTVPAGTYPVATTGEAGTVYASPGVQNGSVYPSFYGKLAANGNITTPLYFLEGGNVVVENVDGHVKVTVAAVNSYDVPIHIVYEAAGTNGGGEDEEKGLPYDATEGEVDRTYGAEDQVFFTTDFYNDLGLLYVDVMPADNSEIFSVGFVAKEIDSKITIPAGTYEINASGEVGTVLASTGLTEDGYVTEPYFAALTADGYLGMPLYFLVSGTVVVENVEGQFKMTVDAVNSNGIPVRITYDPTAGVEPEKTPLQYDAPTDPVDRTYSAKEVVINKGTGYFQVQATAADKSDKLALVLFGAEDDETIIPVGTYEINGTQAAGTALASKGVEGNSVTLSFYGKTNAQGQILVPCYFLVGGTVEVSAADGKLTIEVNAVNSYDVPVHAVIEYDLNAKQGLPVDAQTGAVDKTFTVNDQAALTEKSGYFTYQVTDGKNMLALLIVADKDEKTVIPVGTYAINDSEQTGTVLASTGLTSNNSVTYSFYSTVNAQGQLTTPIYFLVGGTVEVSVEGDKLKMEVNAVNSYDVPVHVVCEYQLEVAEEGLPYDEKEGAVNAVYTTKDEVYYTLDFIPEWGELYVDLMAADGTNMTTLTFMVEAADDEINVPAGVYPIADTYEVGTAMSGMYDAEWGPMGSFYAEGGIDNEGYFAAEKVWYMVNGTITVENNGGFIKITVDATNSYDVPVKVVYNASPTTAVENTKVENSNASKVVKDNQIFILKDGVKYNVLGSVVK